MKVAIEKQEAERILEKYIKDDFLLLHSHTVEKVMGYFADKLGYSDEKDYWCNVGLLHDVDFELYPDEHCIKAKDILADEGVSQEMINSIISHAYSITQDAVKPEHEMEKVLFAADELTGLIWATALMRPSKSVEDLELKSVKKKFKTVKFAAGCDREVIKQGCEMLGWELDHLIEETILAMRG